MIRINLLPVREERRKADLRQFGILVAVTLVASLAVAMLFETQLQGSLARAEQRVANLEKQIDSYQPQLEQVKKYRETKKRIEQKLEVIEDLERRRKGPVRVLDELATHAPERLWVTQLSAHDGKITLSGMSLANELVASFLEVLSDSPYFTNVELLETNATKKQGIKLNQFELSATLVTPEDSGADEEVQETAALTRGASPAAR